MNNRTLLVRIGAALCIAVVLSVLLFSREPEAEIDEINLEPQFDTELDSVAAIPHSAAVPYYRFAAKVGEKLRADTSVVAGTAPPLRGGRKVAISVCGVDSRVGEHVEHADANHVIVIWLDSGVVDVLSIPRGTPANAGTARPALNILANVRAYRGRKAYLREVASIAGLDTIDYYVDFGFSQARGLLETLGFGSTGSGDALKVLRARRMFPTGDYQRSYNQGQFIRQALLRRFGDIDGFTGGLLLRAGLALVNTNLTMDVVGRIAGDLRKSGFPSNAQAAQVFLRPDYHAKMAVYDFADSTVLGSLIEHIRSSAAKTGIVPGASDTTATWLQHSLEALMAKAAIDTTARPQRVVALLRRPFFQRVWWQLDDTTQRARIRTEMGALLAHAYRSTKDTLMAENVLQVVESENEWMR